jgi:hypothetical protein
MKSQAGWRQLHSAVFFFKVSLDVSSEMLMWLCPKMMEYHQMVNFRASQRTFARGICGWLRQHYSEDVQKQAIMLMELEDVLEIHI